MAAHAEINPHAATQARGSIITTASATVHSRKASFRPFRAARVLWFGIYMCILCTVCASLCTVHVLLPAKQLQTRQKRDEAVHHQQQNRSMRTTGGPSPICAVIALRLIKKFCRSRGNQCDVINDLIHSCKILPACLLTPVSRYTLTHFLIAPLQPA